MLGNFTKKVGDIAQTAAKKSGDIAQTAAKKSSKLAQTAAKKSGDVVEITKLNMNITSEENSIEKLYAELGKVYYSIFEGKTELETSIAELCKAIKCHKDNIEDLKEKINLIKGAQE